VATFGYNTPSSRKSPLFAEERGDTGEGKEPSTRRTDVNIEMTSGP
jgi:hypothetical protein